MTDGKKAYFLSDAHLGAAYIPDNVEHEKRVSAMLDMMGRDACAVYMLGDMLDFWFEYRNVVPRGFVRFFGAVQRLTDQGIPVYWFKGNHDMWTTGYLRQQLGVAIVDEDLVTEIGGKSFFLSHGDGVGKMPQSYAMLRAIFRNETCRRLGAALHPRWLMGFGLKWSSHNRLSRINPSAETEEKDLRQQLDFANAYAATHPDINYFVIGHSHIAKELPVNGGSARLVSLGDCFKQYTYAVFDGENLSLKQFDSAK